MANRVFVRPGDEGEPPVMLYAHIPNGAVIPWGLRLDEARSLALELNSAIVTATAKTMATAKVAIEQATAPEPARCADCAPHNSTHHHEGTGACLIDNCTCLKFAPVKELAS